MAAAAGLEWAKKVFPNAASDEEAVDLLWDQIFKTCRVYEEDPVKAWEEHAAILKSKADMLNKEQFSALHYTAPGTDLTLGLPKNHVLGISWCYQCAGRRILTKYADRGKFSQHQTSVAQMVMSLLQNRLATTEISSKALK